MEDLGEVRGAVAGNQYVEWSTCNVVSFKHKGTAGVSYKHAVDLKSRVKEEPREFMVKTTHNADHTYTSRIKVETVVPGVTCASSALILARNLHELAEAIEIGAAGGCFDNIE